MVTETGEATARFLKSIARGEIDPKETINEQAQLGLKRVRSMRAEDRPSDCRLASRQLVRGFTFCHASVVWSSEKYGGGCRAGLRFYPPRLNQSDTGQQGNSMEEDLPDGVESGNGGQSEFLTPLT